MREFIVGLKINVVLVNAKGNFINNYVLLQLVFIKIQLRQKKLRHCAQASLRSRTEGVSQPRSICGRSCLGCGEGSSSRLDFSGAVGRGRGSLIHAQTEIAIHSRRKGMHEF
jgi:hypothetical protein